MLNDDTLDEQIATVRFRVSEGGTADSQSAITAQAELPLLGESGFVGLEVRPGTSHEDVKRVVEFLNQHIVKISLNRFIPPIGQSKVF